MSRISGVSAQHCPDHIVVHVRHGVYLPPECLAVELPRSIDLLRRNLKVRYSCLHTDYRWMR
jgi:hypothetical protein